MVGEGEEVGGQEAGEEVHFSRVISAGGASSYRLNDKEVCVCVCVSGWCGATDMTDMGRWPADLRIALDRSKASLS